MFIIKTLRSSACLLLLWAPLFSQTVGWRWAVQASSNGSEMASDLTRDPTSGNLYVGGYYDNLLSGTFGTLFLSPGLRDGFIAKYNSLGTLLSAFPLGSFGNDEVSSVACDPSGNLYATGYFNGTVDFDPSLAAYTLTASGTKDGFLAKYNSSGALQWAVKFGGTLNDEGVKVAATSSNVCITGYYESSATFQSTSSVTIGTGTAQTGITFFGANYNSNGVVQWVVTGGGAGSDLGYGVCVDNSKAYFVGTYQNTFILYNSSGSPSSTLSTQQANKLDVFVAAYDLNGGFAWSANASSTDDDAGYTITQDASRIYIGGYYKGTLSMPYPSPTFTLSNAGGSDLLVAALSKSNGSYQWVWDQSGSGTDEEQVTSLSADNAGNLIIAGGFKGTLSYTASGGPTVTSQGNDDVFISKVSTSGVFEWISVAGGGNVDIPHGIATASTGLVYVAGEYANSAIFGSATLTNMLSKNIFVASAGCEALSNNSISGTQTVCAGSTVSGFTGSIPTGVAGTYTYIWQQSSNNNTWTAAGGTNTISTSYTPAPLNSSAYFRRVVMHSSGCPSIGNTVQVTAMQQPGPAVLSVSNQTICASSATLSAITLSVGVGTWSLAQGSGSISSQNSLATLVSELGAGDNVFVWTVVNAPCPANSASVSVYRDLPPATASVSPNQTLCASTATFTALSPSIGTGSWSVINGGALLSSSTTASTSVSNLTVGLNVFGWTVANGICPSSSATLTIQRDDFPTPANAGSNQTVCASSVTLNGNLPSVGSGSWTAITGTGSIQSASSSTTSVSGLSAGSNQFAWAIGNGVCAASVSTVTIVRDLIPSTASAGINQTLCASAGTLSALPPSVGTGSWSVLNGGGSLASAVTASTSVSNLTVGVNVFEWTVINGICPSSSATVSIQRDALPTTANAGSNQTICATTFTLNGNIPVVGTGSWSVLNGTASIQSSFSSSTSVSGLSAGNNQFAWTITNGVCAASASTVTIIRDLNPSTAVAGANQTVCATTATLDATSPSIGTGSWTVLNGGANLSSSIAPGTSVSNLTTGVNVFAWTVVNGVCPASSATVSVQRDAFPTVANAGGNQTLCASSVTLNGNLPSIGTGSWTVLSGTASIQSQLSPSTSASGLSAGSNQFVWTITNGVCAASISTVLIVRDLNPSTANAGTNQTLCATTASLSAIPPSIGTGSWSVLGGSALLTSPATVSTSLSNLTVGLNIFQWTVINGVCLASFATVSIQRDAVPTTANAGSNQTICASSITLNGNPPSVGTGSWTVLSGTASLQSATSSTTSASGLSAGNNQFVWTVANGVCPASASTVTIVRDLNPSIADAGTSQTICTATTSLSALTPSIGTGSWTVLSGGASLSSSATPGTAVSNLAIGINTFEWMVVNGVCPSSTATLSIQRDAPPSQASVASDQTVCAANATISAIPPVSGTGAWSVIGGTANIPAAAIPTTQAFGLSPGANTFVWSITSGVCPSTSDTISIKRDMPPDQALAGSNQTICGNSATLIANSPLIGTGSWQLLTGSANLSNPANYTTSVSALATGSSSFKWTISSGTCPSSSDTVEIFSFELPGPASAGNDNTICSPTIILTAAIPAAGTGSWKILEGGASLSNTISITPVASSLSNGANIFVWTVANGICPVASDTVVITRDAEPTPAAAGSDTIICGKSITMQANAPVHGNGMWTLISGNAQVDTPQAPQSAVSGLSEGTHFFEWKISSGACPPSADTVKVKVYWHPGLASAGADKRICSNQVTLAAQPALAGKGSWSLVEGIATIPDTNSAVSVVNDIRSKKIVARWTLSNGVCPVTSDELTIIRDTIIASAAAGENVETELFNLRLSASAPVDGSGTWTVVDGSGILSNPGDPQATVSGLQPGINILRWSVTYGECPATTDDIAITVKPFSIPNAISPNGDGKNDVFHITGLENYSDAKLTIFNRWGAVVYSNPDYRNDWRGTNAENVKLTDDTYYFILEVPGLANSTGFLIIKTDR
jgi:gliding motility-associated-like protein